MIFHAPFPATSEQVPSAAEQTRWFVEEVQPHESKLRNYLHTRFSSIAEPDDLLQETYLRLCRAHAAGKSASRAFLYTIARNVACDLLRRRRIVSFEALTDIDRLSVIADEPNLTETVSRNQEIALLHEAIAALPDRCRLIMILQRIHALSNREIAEKLGISVNTVNAQIVIGLARCREFLRARGILRGKQP